MNKKADKTKRRLALLLSVAMILGNVGVSFADEKAQAARESEALSEVQESSQTEAGAGEKGGAQVVEDAEGVPRANLKSDAETVKGEKAGEADGEEKRELGEKDSSVEGIVFTETVENMEVTAQATLGVLPEGAKLSVSRIRSDEELKKIEDAINEESPDENPVEEMIALDIKFMKDDAEVQPDGEVKVSFKNIAIEAATEDLSVFHVDTEKNEVEDMQAESEGEDTLEFETPHFSTYVIVYGGTNGTSNVTINHYNGDYEYGQNKKLKDYNGTGAAPSQSDYDNARIYLSDVKTVSKNAAGESYIEHYTKVYDDADDERADADKQSHYTIAKVVVTEKNASGSVVSTKTLSSVSDWKSVSVSNPNVVIDVYYVPKTKKETGFTTLYDYTLMAGNATVSGSWSNSSLNNDTQISYKSGSNNRTAYYYNGKFYKNRTWNNRSNKWEYKNNNELNPLPVSTDGYFYFTSGNTSYRYKDGTVQKGSNSSSFNNVSINSFDWTGAEPWWEDGTVSKVGDSQRRYLTVGASNTGKQDYPNYEKYRLKWKLSSDSAGDLYPNEWTGETEINITLPDGKRVKTNRTMTGLLDHLDSTTHQPVFKYANPGFFNNKDVTVTVNGQEKYLRQHFTDYTLEFDAVGDKYTLNRVVKPDGTTTAAKAGDNFFPLNGAGNYGTADAANDKNRNDKHDNTYNYFFGMRYDVEFTLGDYCGPLEYYFSGDDDIWVVIDDKVIALELAGIHLPVERTIDLWPILEENGIAKKRAK